MFNAIKTHSGQYRRYGDTYYEWDIETDLPEKEVLDKCLRELLKEEDLPEGREYSKNTAYGGPKAGDYAYIFRGYYTLSKTPEGYHFTKCRPYAD